VQMDFNADMERRADPEDEISRLYIPAKLEAGQDAIVKAR